jgi:hypothetical protein
VRGSSLSISLQLRGDLPISIQLRPYAYYIPAANVANLGARRDPHITRGGAGAISSAMDGPLRD